jgi:hypothetical protein
LGARWWVCRSANAAIKSGLRFREIIHDDGTIERWQQSKLQASEMPKRNPHERRPPAPKGELKAAATEIAEPTPRLKNASELEGARS